MQNRFKGLLSTFLVAVSLGSVNLNADLLIVNKMDKPIVITVPDVSFFTSSQILPNEQQSAPKLVESLKAVDRIRIIIFSANETFKHRLPVLGGCYDVNTDLINSNHNENGDFFLEISEPSPNQFECKFTRQDR